MTNQRVVGDLRNEKKLANELAPLWFGERNVR